MNSGNFPPYLYNFTSGFQTLILTPTVLKKQNWTSWISGTCSIL